jgi:hypothetical protein
MTHRQSQAKGRAPLAAVVILAALLAVGGWRVGVHAGGVTTHLTQLLQATQHLLGGGGGLAEGGGPPGHQ